MKNVFAYGLHLFGHFCAPQIVRKIVRDAFTLNYAPSVSYVFTQTNGRHNKRLYITLSTLYINIFACTPCVFMNKFPRTSSRCCTLHAGPPNIDKSFQDYPVINFELHG